jgi:predicted unusual protein kinase regulating ubiquinone biosynthesis (AarF/ABC1/UbiB family)
VSDVPSSLTALVETGVALARRTTSGSLVFGRLAGVVTEGAVPRRARAELDEAFARTAVPVEARAVERVLRGAWGRAPGRVLDDWSDEPLSVSPTAQVHAASFDGQPIAVKVLRPGVAATVRSELALLDLLAAPLAAAFPGLDAARVVRELREAALDELDLEHEGDQQRRVARALRRVEGLVVPDVVSELTGSEVLVTALLGGPSLASGAVPEDPPAVARRLVEAHLVAWREAGLAMTDARPSHVLVLDDGRTGLLGTGVAQPVPRERAALGVAALAAVGDPDPAASAAAARDLGVLPEADAAAAHAIARDVLGDLAGGPALLDGAALGEVSRRAAAHAGALAALGARATPSPPDLAAGRMLAQLVATLARLGVTEDWAALARRLV